MLLVSRDATFASQDSNAWRTRREESPVGLSRLTGRKEFTSSDAVLPDFVCPVPAAGRLLRSGSLRRNFRWPRKRKRSRLRRLRRRRLRSSLRASCGPLRSARRATASRQRSNLVRPLLLFPGLTRPGAGSACPRARTAHSAPRAARPPSCSRPTPGDTTVARSAPRP